MVPQSILLPSKGSSKAHLPASAQQFRLVQTSFCRAAELLPTTLENTNRPIKVRRGRSVDVLDP